LKLPFYIAYFLVLKKKVNASLSSPKRAWGDGKKSYHSRAVSSCVLLSFLNTRAISATKGSSGLGSKQRKTQVLETTEYIFVFYQFLKFLAANNLRKPKLEQKVLTKMFSFSEKK
jgi:hypothetical protein